MKNNKINSSINDCPKGCNDAICIAFNKIQDSNTADTVNNLISTLRANAKSVPSKYANGINTLINIFYNYNLYFSQLNPTFNDPAAFASTAGFYNLAYWCTNTEPLSGLATFNTAHVNALMKSQSIIKALAPLAPLGDTENIFTAAYCAGIDTTSQSFNFQLNYNTIATNIQKLITAAAPTTTFDYSDAIGQMTTLAKDITAAQTRVPDQKTNLTILSTYVTAVQDVLTKAATTDTPATLNTTISALPSYKAGSAAFKSLGITPGPLTLAPETQNGDSTKVNFSNFTDYDGPVTKLQPAKLTFDYSDAIGQMTTLAKDITAAQTRVPDQKTNLTILSTYVTAVQDVLTKAATTDTPATLNTTISALPSYKAGSAAFKSLGITPGPLTLAPETQNGDSTKVNFSNFTDYDGPVTKLQPAKLTFDYSDAIGQMTTLAKDIVTAQTRVPDQKTNLTILSTYVTAVQDVLTKAATTDTPATLNTTISALPSYKAGSAAFKSLGITPGPLTLAPETQNGDSTKVNFSNFTDYDGPVTKLQPLPPAKALNGSLYFDLNSLLSNLPTGAPLVATDNTAIATSLLDALITNEHVYPQNIIFSFAQFGKANVAQLMNLFGPSPTPKACITPWDSITSSSTKSTNAINVLKAVLSECKTRNISTYLSFGGKFANTYSDQCPGYSPTAIDDWVIPSDPVTQTALAKAICNFGFTGVDVFLDDMGLEVVSDSTKFQTLQATFTAMRTEKLRTMMTISQEMLASVITFYSQTEAPVFTSAFDAIQLKAFADKQTNTQFASFITRANISLLINTLQVKQINIGFLNADAYIGIIGNQKGEFNTLCDSHQSYGQCAATILYRVDQEETNSALYRLDQEETNSANQLGTPFIWDYLQSKDCQSRYKPAKSGTSWTFPNINKCSNSGFDHDFLTAYNNPSSAKGDPNYYTYLLKIKNDFNDFAKTIFVQFGLFTDLQSGVFNVKCKGTAFDSEYAVAKAINTYVSELNQAISQTIAIDPKNYAPINYKQASLWVDTINKDSDDLWSIQTGFTEFSIKITDTPADQAATIIPELSTYTNPFSNGAYDKLWEKFRKCKDAEQTDCTNFATTVLTAKQVSTLQSSIQALQYTLCSQTCTCCGTEGSQTCVLQESLRKNCPNEAGIIGTIANSTSSYLQDLSDALDSSNPAPWPCSNGSWTQQCFCQYSENKLQDHSWAFDNSSQIAMPIQLTIDSTATITATSKDAYTSLVTNVCKVCSGGKPNVAPTQQQWSGLLEKFTALKSAISTSSKNDWHWPLQTSGCLQADSLQAASGNCCVDPGVMSFKTEIEGYTALIVQSMNTQGPTGIDAVNATIESNYQWNIEATKCSKAISPTASPNFSSADVPNQIILSFKEGDTDITCGTDSAGKAWACTDAIAAYTNFYTKKLVGYCSQIQDYTQSLKDQVGCFQAFSKQIGDWGANAGSADSMVACDPSTVASCIKTHQPCIKEVQKYASEMATYLTALQDDLQKQLPTSTDPISLATAQTIIANFNSDASNIWDSSTIKLDAKDLNLSMVQLSTPKSMQAPILGCLWGNIPTAFGHLKDKYSSVVDDCAGAAACVTQVDPTTPCTPTVITKDFSWSISGGFNELFNDMCSLTQSVPKSSLSTYCQAINYVRYMTGGKVWSPSIQSFHDCDTNPDSCFESFLQACCSETKASDSLRGLIKNHILSTVEIEVPVVDTEITNLHTEAPSLDSIYQAYASYFNKMNVWLKFYFGNEIGTFLVNALNTNYISWYNDARKNQAKIDFTKVTDLAWKPLDIIGDATTPHTCNPVAGGGVIDQYMCQLQDLVTDKIYMSFKQSLSDTYKYQGIAADGKYKLALAMESTDSARPNNNTIIDTLSLLKPHLDDLNQNLAISQQLQADISQRFLKMITSKDTTSFLADVKATIAACFDDDFKSRMARAQSFLTEGAYPALLKGLPQQDCASGTGQCGSQHPGARASVWQDVGAMWSHFPQPDIAPPAKKPNPPSNTINDDPPAADPGSKTIDDISCEYKSFFEKNALEGVFNYHLSFAQLKVVSNILNLEQPGLNDLDTLDDTILPYVNSFMHFCGNAGNAGSMCTEACSDSDDEFKKRRWALGCYLSTVKKALLDSTNKQGKLGFSFGGENASCESMDNRFLAKSVMEANKDCKTKDDDACKSAATQAAKDFYTYFLKYVDSTDFDNENAGFIPQNYQALFFETLRSEIGSLPATEGQPQIILTLLGDPGTSIKLGMGDLMTSNAQYFDYVNLMLYGNGADYYITANAATAWSVQAWANAIDIQADAPCKSLSKLYPCYQDLTPYYDPSADSGESGPNWAIQAKAQILDNYSVDITTLGVGEAAWVLNRQLWQDTYESYPAIKQEDVANYLDSAAQKVSWWPDNNYHGSIPDGNKQYGPEQAFNASQILWMQGFNPFTYESLPYGALQALQATIDEFLKDQVKVMISSITKKYTDEIAKKKGCILSNFTTSKNQLDAISQYLTTISTNISSDLQDKTKTPNTLAPDALTNLLTAIPPSIHSNLPADLVLQFTYTKGDSAVIIKPALSTYTTELKQISNDVDSAIHTCDPAATAPSPHQGVLETYWDLTVGATPNIANLLGSTAPGGEIDLFFQALSDGGIDYLNCMLGGWDLFTFADCVQETPSGSNCTIQTKGTGSTNEERKVNEVIPNIMELANSHNIKLKICIGGGVASPTLTKLQGKDPTYISSENWITNLGYLNKAGFSGIDFDLEQEVPFDENNLTCTETGTINNISHAIYQATNKGASLEGWDVTWTMAGDGAILSGFEKFSPSPSKIAQIQNLLPVSTSNPSPQCTCMHRVNAMMYTNEEKSWCHISGWPNQKAPPKTEIKVSAAPADATLQWNEFNIVNLGIGSAYGYTPEGENSFAVVPAGNYATPIEDISLIPFYTCTGAQNGIVWITENFSTSGQMTQYGGGAVPDVTIAPYDRLASNLCFLKQQMIQNCYKYNAEQKARGLKTTICPTSSCTSYSPISTYAPDILPSNCRVCGESEDHGS